jgi:hypothetical protein
MKRLILIAALLSSAAFAQQPAFMTLQCTKDVDTDAGLVQFNSSTNVVTIQGFSWNVVPDGTGIIVAGSLGVAGPYLRMNRFNGVVMARWNPSTPPGAVDFAAVCDVKTRKF